MKSWRLRTFNAEACQTARPPRRILHGSGKMPKPACRMRSAWPCLGVGYVPKDMVVSRGECITGLTWDPREGSRRPNSGQARDLPDARPSLRALAPGQAGDALTV